MFLSVCIDFGDIRAAVCLNCQEAKYVVNFYMCCGFSGETHIHAHLLYINRIKVLKCCCLTVILGYRFVCCLSTKWPHCPSSKTVICINLQFYYLCCHLKVHLIISLLLIEPQQTGSVFHCSFLFPTSLRVSLPTTTTIPSGAKPTAIITAPTGRDCPLVSQRLQLQSNTPGWMSLWWRKDNVVIRPGAVSLRAL